MNILITNDDGIASDGILALEKVLKRQHNTFLVAPLKEKSATSMALSIFNTLRVERVNHDHYIIDGYPVDCVNIGLHGNIFPEIDMVVSGVNRGVNMGHDVHYSGTVGAARHGSIHNRLALAVSSGNIDPEYDYVPEAEMILEFIESFGDSLTRGIVYNFNFPPDFSPGIEQIKVTTLGERTYVDEYVQKHIIDGISEFFLGGSELGHKVGDENTDFSQYEKGFVSLTPLQLDQTNTDGVRKLEKHLSSHAR